MTYAHRRPVLGRRFLYLAVATMAAVAMVFAAMAGSSKVERANAYTVGNFCEPGGNWSLILAGGRCVDYRRVNHRYIKATLEWVGEGTGQYCVGAKKYADGTGANTEGFGCSAPLVTKYTSTGPVSPTFSPALGYATIINNTGWYNGFKGYMEWY
jgi:hypothetical protein